MGKVRLGPEARAGVLPGERFPREVAGARRSQSPDGVRVGWNGDCGTRGEPVSCVRKCGQSPPGDLGRGSAPRAAPAVSFLSWGCSECKLLAVPPDLPSFPRQRNDSFWEQVPPHRTPEEPGIGGSCPPRASAFSPQGSLLTPSLPAQSPPTLPPAEGHPLPPLWMH